MLTSCRWFAQALCPKEASGGAIQPGNVTITRTMHQRKRMMAEMSDAFIALPGGFGTFEELFEMITWTQLGIHRKTVAILNVGGYYDKLLGFLDDAVAVSCAQSPPLSPHPPTLTRANDGACRWCRMGSSTATPWTALSLRSRLRRRCSTGSRATRHPRAS